MRLTDYIASLLERLWYQKPRWYHRVLSPLSGFYRCVIALRAAMYRLGVFTRYRASVPVIVVGNITVGGTGKTPFVMGLVEHLKEQGYRPGVVSRGYGAKLKNKAILLDANSTVDQVGDEPCMMYQRLQVPVAVCPRRVLAIQACEKAGCDVIISDDGLAHYAFFRDIEVVCMDALREFGSGYVLPVGPLREPKSRLESVSFCVKTTHSRSLQEGLFSCIKPLCLVSVSDLSCTLPLTAFKNKAVQALAGIGHPERFFALLSELGYDVSSQVFRDHHRYTKKDLFFRSDIPLIMTEKDAIKCRSYGLRNAWFLKITAEFDYSIIEKRISTVRCWD